MKKSLCSGLLLAIFLHFPMAAHAQSTKSDLQDLTFQIELQQLKNDHAIERQQAEINKELAILQREWQAAKDHLGLQKGDIENGRFTIQTWVASISVAFTIFIFLASLMAWRFKERIDSEWQSIRKAIHDDFEKLKSDVLEELIITKKEAEVLIAQMHLYVSTAEQGERDILRIVGDVRDKGVKVAFAPSHASAAVNANPAAERLITLAHQFTLDEKWDEAIHLWRSLTQLYPDNASAWFNLGYAMYYVRPAQTRTEKDYQEIHHALEKSYSLHQDQNVSQLMEDVMREWSSFTATNKQKTALV